jgi:hypothetical protein
MKLTTEIFIERSNKLHNNKYNYDNVVYKNYLTKVNIICPIHGSFWQTPNDHLAGCGCNYCKKEKARENSKINHSHFLQKAKMVHGDRYDYSKAKYVDYATKVKIICKIHGEFEQLPSNHFHGHNCMKCSLLFKKHKGYSRNEWVDFCKNKISYIYLIELYNTKEKFYKIGITSNPTNRFNTLSKVYNINKIKIFSLIQAGTIFDIETKLHKELKEFKYTPKINFCGYSECYLYTDIIYSSFIKTINEYNNCNNINFIKYNKLSKITNSKNKK